MLTLTEESMVEVMIGGGNGAVVMGLELKGGRGEIMEISCEQLRGRGETENGTCVFGGDGGGVGYSH